MEIPDLHAFLLGREFLPWSDLKKKLHDIRMTNFRVLGEDSQSSGRRRHIVAKIRACSLEPDCLIQIPVLPFLYCLGDFGQMTSAPRIPICKIRMMLRTSSPLGSCENLMNL